MSQFFPGSFRVPRAGLPLTALGSVLLITQAAQAAQPAAASDNAALEEVVVTAQFRSENLQETPLAITAVSGERLDEQGLSNVAELGLVIPNANFRPNPGNGPTASIGMRGVNTTEFIYTTEPGVAVYIDDIYHGTLTGSAMDLLDLERVEVLRGPQGTLFGKNALGGAIRLISKQPKGNDSGYVEATYGTSNRLDFKAGFDMAVTDKLFVRVTGVSTQIDGYQDTLDFKCQMIANGTPALAGNLPSEVPSNAQTAGSCKTGENGGSQNRAIRAMVRMLASDKLELNVSADYARTIAQAGAQVLLKGTQSAGLDLLYNNLVIQPRFGLRYDDDRFVTASKPFTTYQSWRDPVKDINWPRDQVTETWSTSGKLDYSFSEKTHLKFVAAHRQYDSTWAGPSLVPLGGATLNLQTHKQDSAELQLNGSWSTNVDWTVGAFYFDSSSALGGRVDFGPLAYFGIIPSFDQNDHFTTKSKSAFAHVVWRISDALSLTTGVRETDEKKTFAFDHTGYLTVATPLRYGQSHFDWKAALDYKINDDAMVYGMVSTGFRSDGAQPRPWAPNQLKPVSMEEIRAYEVGAKTDFLEKRLRVNLSAFLNDYDPRVASQFGQSCSPTAADPGPFVPFGTPLCPAGTQLAGQPPSAGAVNWFYYFSAPGKARGAELEVTAQPVPRLNLNASAGFYSYKSGVARGASGYIDPSVREQPRLSYSLGAQYALPIGEAGTLTPRIDMFHQGHRTNGTINLPQLDPYNIIPGYNLVNARITYTSSDDKWTAALSAENLFDKFYWHQLGAERNTASGAIVYGRTGAPARGREIAFTLRRTF